MDDWRLCLHCLHGSSIYLGHGCCDSNIHGKRAFQPTQKIQWRETAARVQAAELVSFGPFWFYKFKEEVINLTAAVLFNSTSPPYVVYVQGYFHCRHFFFTAMLYTYGRFLSRQLVNTVTSDHLLYKVVSGLIKYQMFICYFLYIAGMLSISHSM